MAQQMEVSSDVGYHASRLVWVLNKDEKQYAADFQGINITIPASGEKIPKHVRDGGNLMGYLDARHFITDYKQPQGFTVDERGNRRPVFGPKALYSQDLTEAESEKIVGKTKDQIKKELVSDERKARKKLTSELNKVTNKIAVGDDD